MQSFLIVEGSYTAHQISADNSRQQTRNINFTPSLVKSTPRFHARWRITVENIQVRDGFPKFGVLCLQRCFVLLAYLTTQIYTLARMWTTKLKRKERKKAFGHCGQQHTTKLCVARNRARRPIGSFTSLRTHA